MIQVDLWAAAGSKLVTLLTTVIQGGPSLSIVMEALLMNKEYSAVYTP